MTFCATVPTHAHGSRERGPTNETTLPPLAAPRRPSPPRNVALRNTRGMWCIVLPCVSYGWIVLWRSMSSTRYLRYLMYLRYLVYLRYLRYLMYLLSLEVLNGTQRNVGCVGVRSRGEG